ncbi:hypothetical protein HELRODRAFT_172085 [Helobdella robusta]|uniref:Death domain-containing protein n=1 Tax=Helobdella robusta TaxID=6412 RepID=T1F506_HELRO|nr:hypothetical protein HELRODRAFT_172085 [Helobdella robusta]ESO05069.1 hypothetical protein HELRODRAFT_172085 [Helobdella robusta]
MSDIQSKKDTTPTTTNNDNNIQEDSTPTKLTANQKKTENGGDCHDDKNADAAAATTTEPVEDELGNHGEDDVPIELGDLDLNSDLAALQQPQLDTHLAYIEEQFRRGFDERFSASKQQTSNKLWEDPMETMRTNKIFREVSRGLGCDWRPVFEELMSPFPKEILEMELGKISQNQPIIQGYKALTAWKELSGKSFLLMRLVDVLRNQNMDDIADVVVQIIDDDGSADGKSKPTKSSIARKKSDLSAPKSSTVLDNRRLLLIAKKIEGDYELLAKELGIPEDEVEEIKESEGSTYQGAFKVLWAWKESRPAAPVAATSAEGSGDAPPKSELEVLKEALVKVGKKDVAEHLESLK